MSREPSTPSVLHSVASMLGRQVTRDRLVRVMIDRVVEELGAERGTISLVDAITGELWSRVAHLPEIEEIRMPPGTGVAGHVAETGEPVMLADVTTDEHFFPGIDRMTGYPPGTPLDDVILDHIQRTLEHCDGNRTEAAKLLGIGRNTLTRRLKKDR